MHMTVCCGSTVRIIVGVVIGFATVSLELYQSLQSYVILTPK